MLGRVAAHWSPYWFEGDSIDEASDTLAMFALELDTDNWERL
jgi:hypothetical protein